MKEYLVRFTGKTGRTNYRSFDDKNKAEKFAIHTQGVLEKYNSETFNYDVVAKYFQIP